MGRTTLLFLLIAITLSGCSESTGNDVSKPAPSYSWQGRAVDAVSGEPIATPVFSVLEAAEHTNLGWGPFVGVQRLPDDLFLVDYSIDGISCDPPRDTTLTLTLQVADSLEQHESAVHTSQWHFQCTLVPPDSVTPLPFPTEKDLTIELQPKSQ